MPSENATSRTATCPVCTLVYDPVGTPQGLCHNALKANWLDQHGNPRLRTDEEHRATRRYVENARRR